MSDKSDQTPATQPVNKQTKTWRRCVRRYAKKWRNVFELFGIIAVVASSVFGFLAVYQTTESLEIARKDFDIRNRPRIIPLDAFALTAQQMAGTGRKEWKLTINIKNESDLPAQWVRANLKFYRNQSADSALIHSAHTLRYMGTNETVELSYVLPDSVLIMDGDTPTNRRIELTIEYGRFASDESERRYKTIWNFYIDPEQSNIITTYTKFE